MLCGNYNMVKIRIGSELINISMYFVIQTFKFYIIAFQLYDYKRED